MPARKATASGKWSQSIWDVTPSVGDDVFANGFTVEIDQNVNVGSLRTAVSGVYAVAGGGFTLYQPLSVIASPNGFLAGATTCLTSFVSAGTATLSGNVTGGIVSDIYGINIATDGGSFNLFGNVLGGNNARTYGVLFNSTKNLTVVGDVSGSRNNSVATSHGILNQSVGNCYVTGNVVGGNNASGFGISNNSLGLISVLGNVRGDVGSGVSQNSTGTVLVSGTITASPNAHGVVSASTAARNEFTGTLVNSDLTGRQAVYCAKYLVHPKMFDSATYHKNTEIGNAVLYSEELNNAAWLKVATTVTANLTTSPFGATTADKILEAATADRHYTYPTVTNVTYTTPQVFSIYLKKDAREYVTICNESGSGTNGYSVMYNLTNGTMLSSKKTGTGVLSMSSMEDVGNGWYRCTLGGYLTAGSGTMYSIVAISNRADYSGTILLNHYASYTGNALSGIYAYGAQFEYGTTPTAYLSSTDSVIYKNASVQPVTFYAPEAYSTSYVPHVSSVAVGTAYAAVSSLSGVAVNIPVQLSGTMVVPSEASVSYGTLVGQTTGTAIHTSEQLQQVWNTNINTLTAANSLGARLKSTATVQEVGQQIQNLNL